MQPVLDSTAVGQADLKKLTSAATSSNVHESNSKGFGWLDKLLALWILHAMLIVMLLGNYVPNTGPMLQRGTFVGVSIHIGVYQTHSLHQT
jgi:ACR3 family arsenite transporter